MDEFVADGWYPGFRPGGDDQAPWVADAVRPFSLEDERRFWFLDFHWPRGLTPMGVIAIEDGYAWASQLAAETLPLPMGRGLAQRFVGTHVYATAIELTDDWEIAERVQRAHQRLPAFVRDFDAIWAERCRELDRWWAHLHGADLSALSLSELGSYLGKARRLLRRSAEIHFGLMYPLLVNYLGFYRACLEMGIDAGQIRKFLQGYDSKIMETDRALWQLADKARQAGLADIFAAHEASELQKALCQQASASQWVAEFNDAMQRHGYRTEGAFDVALPSWVEDPTPPLAMIRSFLQEGSAPDFRASLAVAQAERETAIEAARATLTLEEQRLFDAGLASCQSANFARWQDDHNYYIDLRVALPMRWACLQVSARVGADRPDDTLFLFWPELMAVLRGSRTYDAFRDLVAARRQYYDFWRERRSGMPKVLGTVPDSVADPIVIEVFGINARFLDAVRKPGPQGRDAGETVTMRGIPVAPGIARGTARVLFTADELHRLRPGEVLVCESISPNWTPVFGKIAACVCDSGGMLSHAAIVAREYRVPTVTAVGAATVAVHDGDEIEVDGSTGTVTARRSAKTGNPARTAP